MYDDFGKREAIKAYLPPKINKGRQLDKEYFWNIVNTLYEEVVEAVVQNAHKLRKAVDSEDMEQEAITMSHEMADLMSKNPWVSVSTIASIYN